jgi:hypothetical protein
MFPSCRCSSPLEIFANPLIRKRGMAKNSQLLMIVLIIVASTMLCHKPCRAAPLEREGEEGKEQQIGQQMDSQIALVSVTY